MTKQNFLLGAMILMISNIAVKVIGAIFKIPLTNIIGSEGMAYFSAAYSIYVLFYQISTAGLPVAISRMVATADAKGDKKEASRVFAISFGLFFVIGAVGTAIMMLISRKVCEKAEMDGAFYCMLAIAPTIFFICISSAYRGYFQGLQNMIPTAVSQVIEAVGKLSIGIIAAVYFTSRGEDLRITSAWVIAGVTIGVALSTFYIMAYKLMYNNAVKKDSELSFTAPEASTKSVRVLLRELVFISVPIAIGAAIMALPNNIDTLLKPLLSNSGYTEEVATKVYGAYNAMAIPLFNMPPTLVYPIGISLIPVVSAAYVAKNSAKAYSTVESSFRIAAIISMPCAVGMATMSRQIITMLYYRTYNEVIIQGELLAVDVGASALSVMAIAIFAISLIAISNSILQAWHREYVTMISTSTGVAVKLVSAFLILQIPGIGAVGYAASTALCYFAILFVNMFFVHKFTGYVPSISKVFLKPFTSAAVCGVVALTAYKLLCGALNLSWRLSTMVSIAAAGVAYLVTMALLKGFMEEDILLLPKGAKICSLLRKMKILA